MGLVNSRFWMPEYIDDFGNKYYNVGFKVSQNAPKFTELAAIGFLAGSIYTPRSGTLTCSATKLLKPRHVVATFKSGTKIIYPVPRPDVLDDMILILKPSAVDGAIPGEGSDEAICIDYIGEKWNLVPPGIIGAKSSDYKQNAYGTGDFDDGTGKTSYVFDYYSDIAGKTPISVAISNDSNVLRNCQREGMTDYKEKTKALCNASGNNIRPRHFVMRGGIEGDANSILPGGKQDFTFSRNAYVSGIDTPILPGSDQAKEVGKNIVKCAQCLGYQGETISRVDLLIGNKLVG